MLLYRYIPINDLWRLLEVIFSRRLYCASWDQLNDPLEGRFELTFNGKKNFIEYENVITHLIEDRDTWRITSFSEDPSHFLLWSHYADGHKGIAIEMEFSDENPDLSKIQYTNFSMIFDEETDTNASYRNTFTIKTEEWEYEAEWRLIVKQKYYPIEIPIRRILLGPKMNEGKAKILRSILPQSIELVRTQINTSTMKVETNNDAV